MKEELYFEHQIKDYILAFLKIVQSVIIMILLLQIPNFLLTLNIKIILVSCVFLYVVLKVLDFKKFFDSILVNNEGLIIYRLFREEFTIYFDEILNIEENLNHNILYIQTATYRISVKRSIYNYNLLFKSLIDYTSAYKELILWDKKQYLFFVSYLYFYPYLVLFLSIIFVYYFLQDDLKHYIEQYPIAFYIFILFFILTFVKVLLSMPLVYRFKKNTINILYLGYWKTIKKHQIYQVEEGMYGSFRYLKLYALKKEIIFSEIYLNKDMFILMQYYVNNWKFMPHSTILLKEQEQGIQFKKNKITLIPY